MILLLLKYEAFNRLKITFETFLQWERLSLILKVLKLAIGQR